MAQDALNPSANTEATSLMFKLSCKMSQGGFLEQLDRLCGISVNEYNFVHLPWKQLAIVNFTSTEICDHVKAVMQQAAGAPGVCVANLQAGLHQGLAANLAYFCAKCCQQSDYKTLPMILVNGKEVPLGLACDLFVSNDLLVQYLEHLPARGKMAEKGKSYQSYQPRTGQNGNQGASKPDRPHCSRHLLRNQLTGIPAEAVDQCYDGYDVEGVSAIVFSLWEHAFQNRVEDAKSPCLWSCRQKTTLAMWVGMFWASFGILEGARFDLKPAATCRLSGVLTQESPWRLQRLCAMNQNR